MKRRMKHSERGQAIIEVALMIPFLLVLTLGLIEVANAIDTYLVLSGTAREGASMTSRGTPADLPGPDNDALDMLVAAAAPVIDPAQPGRWKIIYSRVGPSNHPDNPNGCADVGDTYVVLDRVERGGQAGVSQVGALCGDAALPAIGAVTTGEPLHVVEIYYEYETITGLDHYGIDVGAFPFYDRAVF